MSKLTISGASTYNFPGQGGLGRSSDALRWATDLTASVNTLAAGTSLGVKQAAYGAVGDGVADDTAAIQAALNAAPINSVVILPPGAYKTAKPLYFGSNRLVHFKGESPKASLLAPSGFIGPALMMGVTEAPDAGTPLTGASGFSLNFPASVAGVWQGYDLRETGLMEMNGRTVFSVSGFWRSDSAGGTFLASYGRRMTGDTADSAFQIYNTGGALGFRANISGVAKQLESSVGLLVNGTIYHVACSYDGTTLRSFINGVMVASLAAPGALVQQPWENVLLGALHNGFLNTELVNDGPRGAVDLLRVSTQAYTSNFTPPSGRGTYTGGDLLYLDNSQTYGSFLVAYGSSGFKNVYLPFLNSHLTGSSTIDRLDVSNIGITSPTLGIFCRSVTDLRIQNVRVSTASVGSILIWNNCFYSFVQDIDQSCNTGNRHGLALTNVAGVTHVQNVKSSVPHMPFVMLQSDACNVSDLFCQDTTDIFVLIQGVQGQAHNTFTNCSFGLEGVAGTPTALMCISEGRSTVLNSCSFNIGNAACPVLALDGIVAVIAIGCTVVDAGGGPATEIIQVRSGNPGLKTFTDLGNTKVSTLPWTTSTTLIRNGFPSTGQPFLSSQDTSATPGAATVNHPSGKVAIAAGASSVVVTNSLVSATSIVTPVLQFVDATLTQILTVVPAAGSFTIRGNANATLATKVAFQVTNP